MAARKAGLSSIVLDEAGDGTGDPPRAHLFLRNHLLSRATAPCSSSYSRLSVARVLCQSLEVANRVPRAKIAEMFSVYVDRQSVEEVARICGVHHATVRRYRVAERWDERLAEIRAKAQQEADYGIGSAMADSLRIVRTYKGKLSEAIQRKRLTADDVSVADLERLVRLEAFVLGAAESRHEVITEFTGWTETELENYARDGELPRKTTGETSGSPSGA